MCEFMKSEAWALNRSHREISHTDRLEMRIHQHGMVQELNFIVTLRSLQRVARRRPGRKTIALTPCLTRKNSNTAHKGPILFASEVRRLLENFSDDTGFDANGDFDLDAAGLDGHGID